MNIQKILLSGGLLLSAALLSLAISSPAVAAPLMCPGIADTLREAAENASSPAIRNQLLGMADGVCEYNSSSPAGAPRNLPSTGTGTVDYCDNELDTEEWYYECLMPR